MITFTSLPSGIRVSDGNLTLVVFPKAAASTQKNQVSLLSTPEETPTPGTVSWPGEYDIGGVTIRGIGHLEGQQSSYVTVMDGTKLLFLSAPLHDWTEGQLESAGEVDVVVLPMTDAKLGQKLVEEFDPRVLIMIPAGDEEASGTLSKNLGAKDESLMKEFKLKGLPQEGREVVILS